MMTHRKSTLMIAVASLCAVLGVWTWGALLRRELLAVLHSTFSMMEKCEGQVIS